MVYHQSLIAVVRHNGKILREMDGAVMLPFGSEYGILIKNLNSRRAVVSIQIDGKDVLEGQRIIVNPNEDVELEGYLGRDGKVTHKFKFIEKTSEISEFRGDRIDDGILRVEYQFEAPVPEVRKVVDVHYKKEVIQPISPWHPMVPWHHTTWCGDQTYGCSVDSCETKTSSPLRGSNIGSFSTGEMSGGPIKAMCSLQNMVAAPEAASVATDGITVKGSSSSQTFRYGCVGEMEKTSHVIVLNLKGVMSTKNKVVEALTVEKKIQCETCGRFSRSNCRYCQKCGTALL